MSDVEDKLARSLRLIGRDPTLRARMIEECKRIETALAAGEINVRDEITGPLIDALHTDVGILRKRLSTGLVFDFHYRSKIAREFVMSTPAEPDHVWEPQTTKLLVRLAAHARHVIIGGAYFGDHALPVAQAMKARGGTCHAFELNADQAAMLQHNAELNQLDNVRVRQMGLWDDEATHLGLEGEDSFAHSTAQGAAGEEANSITVDGYLTREGIEHADLIMLDIEGGELKVLKGARRQLALPVGQAPNLVFEVHRKYVDWSNGLDKVDIVQFVRSFGYSIFAVRDFNENRAMGNKPIELVPSDRAYLEGPPHGFNMLAVKDASLVQGDGFRQCPDVSPKLLAHKSPTLHHPMDGM